MQFAQGILGTIQRHHVRPVGQVPHFFDGHEALICEECKPLVKRYFEYHLTMPDLTRLYPVGTGASGMGIIQLLGYGSYITPIDKPGPRLRNRGAIILARPRIALVDDCITQGWTMNYMTEVLAKELGTVPVKEIVLMGERPHESDNSNRSQSNEGSLGVIAGGL